MVSFQSPRYCIYLLSFILAIEVAYLNGTKQFSHKNFDFDNSVKKAADSLYDERASSSHNDKSLYQYYYLHIPKAGGNGALRFLNEDMEHIHQRKVCNHGFKYEWLNWTQNDPDCVIHMSESYYSPNAKHIMTVVRPPLEHVVSQYFHCKESKDHATRSHLMPSLDVWLEQWTKAQDSKSQKVVREYDCYNPINLQTKKLGNPENNIELLDRFDVIGVLPQLARSTCLMTIEISGIIPPRCNCTNTHRRLRADHGVIHHGDSFKLTKNQTKMINQLTKRDALLYKNGLDIFENHVRYVETKYSFNMC